VDEFDKMGKLVENEEGFPLTSPGVFFSLTEEGSRKFSEMIRKPNPTATEALKEEKKIISEEQLEKFGKEPVNVMIPLKKREDDKDRES